MEQKHVNHLEQISPEDWGKTPSSVKKLVEEMAQQIEQQEKCSGVKKRRKTTPKSTQL